MPSASCGPPPPQGDGEGGKESTHCTYFATFAALQERVEARFQHLRAAPLRIQQLLGTPLAEFIGWAAPVAA